MKLADLAILIQQGEGTTLEFKESFSASFVREVVAFANTVGGKILLGVCDDGTKCGVKASNKLLFRNAGVLFFAKYVRRFFPQAYITCLLARGSDKAHILDRKDFDGGILTDIEDAMRFIERNTRTAYRIEGLRRENIPEYPTKALREAIANSTAKSCGRLRNHPRCRSTKGIQNAAKNCS